MFFIICTLLGMFFIGEGIYCIKSKKEVVFGFSNGKKPKIEDKYIKAYNKALGKLWCTFGFFLILLGLGVTFLREERNSPLSILSTIRLILGVIMLIAIYIIKIEGKYRKK